MRRVAIRMALALTLTAVACAAPSGHAQDRRAAVARGERLFTEQGCYGCHTVGKFGTPLGPDLSRIGARYTERDLVRWLGDPAEQKPNAHMPKLELTPAEITAVAAFLATQRGE